VTWQLQYPPANDSSCRTRCLKMQTDSN